MRREKEKWKEKCIGHIANNKKNEELAFGVIQAGDNEDTLWGDACKTILIC